MIPPDSRKPQKVRLAKILFNHDFAPHPTEERPLHIGEVIEIQSSEWDENSGWILYLVSRMGKARYDWIKITACSVFEGYK